MSTLSGVHMTALGAAAARARHLIFEGSPKILRDEYAQRLLGFSDDQILGLTNSFVKGPSGAALWALRSRYTEDRLAAAMKLGVNQYIILGAGLDSFGLRNVDALGELSVYEVDDPPLQQWKRDRLIALGIPVPNGLYFVPCDLEVTSIATALAETPYNAREPTVVSWLAVTQYLTREAIDATLRWAASLAAGSEIVLTYVVPGEEAEREKAAHAARGTRFATFFAPAEIGDALANAGLVDIEFLTPEQAHRAYFEGRSDGLVAPELERLVAGKSR